MKAINQEGKDSKTDLRSIVRKIREELRRWYGTISVNELTRNTVLIGEIEIMERMITEMEGGWLG